MRDPASGASSMVACPFTAMVHPAGATNVLPPTVVFGVSAVSRSAAACAGSAVTTGCAVDVGRADADCVASVEELFAGGGDEQAARATSETASSLRMARTLPRGRDPFV